MKIEKILVIVVIAFGVVLFLNIIGVFDRDINQTDKVYSKEEVALMWAVKDRDRQISELLKEVEQIHRENEKNWKVYGVDSVVIYNSNDRYADSLRAIYNPKEL